MATTTELNKDMDKLKGDIDDLRADVSAIAGTLKNLGLEQGKEAVNSARKVRDEASRQASAAKAKLEEEIESRPLTSVLGAFGIGFVIGRLLDRRQ